MVSRRALPIVACVAAVLAEAPARADVPERTDDAARADALFARGKAEMAVNRVTTACAAFAESYALDPAEGTLLALGLCHEKQGELVTAFAELRDLHAAATRSGRDDRQRVARAALARVEPRIGRVTLRVGGGAPTCAATAKLDEVPVRAGDVAREMAVLPGTHRVSCERIAGQPWWTELDVRAGDLAVVVVPDPPAPTAGAEARAEAASPVARADAVRVESSGSGRLVLGWTVVGVGGVALGTGAFFGVRAFDGWSAVEGKCNPAACTDPSATSDADRAKTSATVANIAVGAGAVLLAAGLFVVLTNRSDPGRALGRLVEGGGRATF